MSYKRYVKKNGKLYGPYTYHSKKIDGKVISEYRGRSDLQKEGSVKEKLSKQTKNILTFLIIFSLIAMTFFSFGNISGNSVLDVKDVYFTGESLDGALTISLTAGEFLPADSVLGINFENSSYEFILRDVLTEEVASGEFYIKDRDISGSGQGYGNVGSAEVFPSIEFEILVTDSSSEPAGDEAPSGVPPSEDEGEVVEEVIEEVVDEEVEEVVEEVIEEVVEEEVVEEAPAGVPAPEDEGEEEVVEEEVVEGEEDEGEELLDIKVTLEDNDLSDSADLVAFVELESFGKKSPTIDISYYIPDKSTGFIYARTQTDVVQTEKTVRRDFSDLELAPGKYTLLVKTHYGEDVLDEFTQSFTITEENIFKRLSSKIGSFFKRITGNVVLGSEELIVGEVSAEEIYTFEIEEGQEVSIVSGEVDIEINGTVVIVTTSYSELEEGFGELFLGESVLELKVNLSDLDILAEDGEMIVELKFEGEEIVSESVILSVGEAEEIEQVIVNVTLNETIANFTDMNVTIINVTFDNLTIETIQYGAVVGQPVKWKKKIVASKASENITVELPKEAENISVFKVIDEEEVSKLKSDELKKVKKNKEGKDVLEISEEKISIISKSITGNFISGEVSMELAIEEEESRFVKFIKSLFSKITGNVVSTEESEDSLEVVITENATSFEIEYETEAPKAYEKNISGGKEVVISGPDELHYQNVLAFAEIPDSSLESVKLYHIVNGSRVVSDFDSYDTNDDSLVDYIEWVVPHLSNQTYEIIIEIIKAEHLDSNRSIISDVYDLVKARDGNWTTVSDGEYLRVTFEQELDSSKDITIYARSNGSSSVEVYEKDSDELIMVFENVSEDKEYKKYLTGWNGSNDVFDLRVVCGEGNGSECGVEFDFVVDPVWVYVSNESLVSISNLRFEGDNSTHLSLNDSSIVLYMPFDSNLSQSTVYDYSDNDYDGTFNGDSHYINEGFFGGAIKFDGVDGSYIQPSVTGGSFNSQEFTLSSWSKNNQVIAPNDVVVSIAIIGNTDEILQYRYDGVDDVSVNSDFGILIESLNVFTQTEWNHIAVTVNNATQNVTLYINGVAIGEDSSFSLPDEDTFSRILIGSRSGSLSMMNGTIDEVMIHNRSLSSSEVSDLFNNQSARFFNSGVQEFLDQNISLGVDNKINWTMADFQASLDSNFTGRIGGWQEDYGYNVSDVGLVGYWGLNNNSLFGENDSVAFDYSGNGNNGTADVLAVPTLNSKYGGSVNFNGSLATSTINLGNPDSLNDIDQQSNGTTYSAWIYDSSSDTGEHIIVAKGNSPSTTDGEWMFALQTNRLRFTKSYDTTVLNVRLGTILPFNTWTHVAVTWDSAAPTASGVKIFVNGIEDTTRASNTSGVGIRVSDASNAMNIGGWLSRRWIGDLDEVGIWNRSLSADEIQSLYIKGIANRSYSDSQTIESGDNIFTVNSDETNFIAELTYNAASSEFYSPILEGDVQLDSFVEVVPTDFNVSGCRNISEPGVYTMNQTIGPDITDTCIIINVSDVYFDGAGFQIDGVNTGTGIFVDGTVGSELTNVTLINVDINDFFTGIELEFTDFSSVINSSLSSVSQQAFLLDISDNNNITGLEIFDANIDGVRLNQGSINNIFDGGIILDSISTTLRGFRFTGVNSGTIIKNYNITGILDIVGGGIVTVATADNNFIYNNFFNNTVNILQVAGADNFYNTSFSATTSIIGGANSGGNYWAYPNSTGYSETCTVTVTNNVCDNPYNISNGLECVGCSGVNIDELPLSLSSIQAFDTSNNVFQCGVINKAGVYTLNQSILNSAVTCITINVSDVYFDGVGFTIDGIGSNIGINMFGNINNITIKNINISDFSTNIKVADTDNFIIDNINSTPQTLGIATSTSNFGTISNFINIGGSRGIELLTSDHMILINGTLQDNTIEGIRIRNGNDFGNITNFEITNCHIGVGFDAGLDNYVFSNNFFNNTLNIELPSGNNLFFNTTLTATTSIIGGANSGGNYWAYPNGTGYSETCTVTSIDNICDNPMNVTDGTECIGCTGVNIDELPLSYQTAVIPTDFNVSECRNISESGVYTMNQSIIDQTETCIIINVSDVVLDGAGFMLDGTQGFLDIGIHVVGESSNRISNVTIKNINASEWDQSVWVEFADDGFILDSIFDDTRTGSQNIELRGDRYVINNISVNNPVNTGTYGAINTGSQNSNISNIISTRGEIAITLGYNTIGTRVFNSSISGQGDYGIGFTHGTANNNFIYNNFFNNTINIVRPLTNTNYFNITQTAITSIIDGANSGGNYWAYPNGTGYSDTCTVTVTDNICDNPMNVSDGTECVGCSGVNIDELSLSFSEAVAVDNEFPVFTNIGFNITNGSKYFSGSYLANSTITSTNGTAGIEFDEVNYTATNISDLFSADLNKLAVGTYNYFWWAY
ncbi:hypothetical protein KAR91_15605, partial [Candidatus Pacearchaeota archaeon]|nr:hypothetical protein [Candidatus Pacearchaeota archaeon]